MDKEELKRRTKAFAVRVVKMTEALPSTRIADIIARQIIRSATSVGANYRAACRARSQADFISKIGIVEEEADETLYWLQMIVETGLLPETRLTELLREADELVAIFTSSGRTARTSRA